MKSSLLIIGSIGVLMLISSGCVLLLNGIIPSIKLLKARTTARILGAIGFFVAASAIFMIQHMESPPLKPYIDDNLECSKEWTPQGIETKAANIQQTGYVFRKKLSPDVFPTIGIFYNLALPEKIKSETEAECTNANGVLNWTSFVYDQKDYSIPLCTKSFGNDYMLASTEFSLILHGNPVTLVILEAPEKISSLFEELPCFLDSLKFS